MSASMVSIDFPCLVSDEDRHGNIRYYVRKKGQKKIRIRAAKGTPEFSEKYFAAMNSTPTPQMGRVLPGSFEALARLYMGSPAFKVELSLDSRKWRERMLLSLCKTIGDKPYAKIKREHIDGWMDDRVATPEAANNLLKCFRGLFKFAIERKMLSADPTAGIKKIRTFTDGHHTWTVAEVYQYLDRHKSGTNARIALAIALYAGFRRANVAMLGRQHVTADGFIQLRAVKSRRKKNKDIIVPILPTLQAELDTLPATQMTFLQTAFGKPYTAAGLGGSVRQWCDQAGLPHCSLHGLRKAGATIAADNGASDRQLMAIYGWTKADMATLYTEQRDRKKLATEGMPLIRIERPKKVNE